MKNEKVLQEFHRSHKYLDNGSLEITNTVTYYLLNLDNGTFEVLVQNESYIVNDHTGILRGGVDEKN